MRSVSGADSARERQRAAEGWGVGAQPPRQHGAGMTAASAVLRWGGGAP